MNGMVIPTSSCCLSHLLGSAYIESHRHRKAVDWTHVMKRLSDELYPQAEKIAMVMDNLNTRKLASFYEICESEEAHRLSRRFAIHYTPKHGSWLNMAGIELSALVRQCLNRRITDEGLERRSSRLGQATQ